MRPACWLVVWLWLASAALAAGEAAQAATEPATCRPAGLEGLQAALAQARRRDGSGQTDSRRPLPVEVREDLDRLVAATFALDRAGDARALEAVVDALLRGRPVPVSCGRDVRARDRAAARLLGAGYSALEVTDILSGRLTQADIDAAYALRLAGYDAAAAASLDAAVAVRAARTPPRRDGTVPATPRRLDPVVAAELTRLAEAHELDPALVRAVIAAESGGHPGAVSSAGAIGLMQLMPATARMLGVDPWDPLDNLRGGIAYLSHLVRSFGTVRGALVAYNAGPSHAERVARGEAVLYGETRRYLAAIDRSYPLDR